MISTSDFEVKNFNKDVLEDSYRVPVLVDYWAEWCQPCKFLAPIVEKLATEAKGKWKLVKVNTEINPDIAAEWGIRGIPNLKLFYKGEVIDEVSGAMPEEDMKRWLDEKLPSKAKSLTMEAARLLEIGKIEEGIARLEEALSEDESLEQARLLMARQKIWLAPEDVPNMLEGMTYLESSKEILLMAGALTMQESDFEEGVSKAEIVEALSGLREKEFAKSIDLLIKAIMINKPYHNEFARKLVIALFHYLGEGNEITRTYRRRFDMALY